MAITLEELNKLVKQRMQDEAFWEEMRRWYRRQAAQRPRNPEPVLPVEATDVDFSE